MKADREVCCQSNVKGRINIEIRDRGEPKTSCSVNKLHNAD